MVTVCFMSTLIIELYNINEYIKCEREMVLPKKKQNRGRRSFIKKAMWSAPVLTAMGQMLKPTGLHGESNIPDPPFGMTSIQNEDNGINSPTIFDEKPLGKSD